jgi:hypothetical protein
MREGTRYIHSYHAQIQGNGKGSSIPLLSSIAGFHPYSILAEKEVTNASQMAQGRVLCQ